MAIQLQLRRGTTTEHNTFTGAVGEVTVDTDKKTVVVHDGTTVGGHPVAAKANTDGTISLIKKDGTSAGTINALGLFNNTLTSTNTNQALTAAQGKVLNDLADTKLAATSAFGVGQTWQNMTSSRVSGTKYTNSTTRAIELYIYSGVNGSSVTVDDGVLPTHGSSMIQLVVPSGKTYSYGGSFSDWWELR